jgi:hypothetical protein
MAFLSGRPIASRFAIGLLLVGALAAVPLAESAAQTKAARSESTVAEAPQAAPGAGARDVRDQPATATDAAKSGESSPSRASGDAQERDRRLVLLRLLVLGGGSYRPFGFFR